MCVWWPLLCTFGVLVDVYKLLCGMCVHVGVYSGWLQCLMVRVSACVNECVCTLWGMWGGGGGGWHQAQLCIFIPSASFYVG